MNKYNVCRVCNATRVITINENWFFIFANIVLLFAFLAFLANLANLANDFGMNPCHYN